MAKFEDLKPGTKVKIVSNPYDKHLDPMLFHKFQKYIGLKAIVVINDETVYLPIQVIIEGLTFWFYPENLEIVEEK